MTANLLVMTLTINIAEKAVAMLEEYGPDAPGKAAGMADEMLLAGNLYERRTWRRVHQAICEVLGRRTEVSGS